MSFMFNCASHFNCGISNWDVSHAIGMKCMFAHAIGFNVGMPSWNITNNRAFQNMFHNATSFNQDLSTWIIYSQSCNTDGMFAPPNAMTEAFLPHSIPHNWFQPPPY